MVKKILCQVHHTFQARANLWRCTPTNGNRADTHKVYRSLIQREKEYSPSINMFWIFLNYEQIKPPKESTAPSSKLSEAEYHTRLLLEEQRNQILSEARSEMNVQEFLKKKKKSADMVLRESNRQIHSHRMGLYQANQVYENSRREQIPLFAEMENRERDVQESRIRTLQAIEELTKICCTEAERTQRLRMHELSRQELQESQSTVSQLTVRIEEFRDTVNALNGSRDFHDSETASSTGLSHVPSHPEIVQCSFGIPCRDSCPQPDTRNLCGTSGHVFENLSASDEPTASCSRNVYARRSTAMHGEPVFQRQGELERELMEEI